GRGEPLLHDVARDVRVVAAAREAAHVDETLDTGAPQQLDDLLLRRRAVPERQQRRPVAGRVRTHAPDPADRAVRRRPGEPAARGRPGEPAVTTALKDLDRWAAQILHVAGGRRGAQAR